MIVDTMTHAEVYRELAADRELVTRWWRHCISGLRRIVLKSPSFPCRFWREHVSPRRNRYLFDTCIFDKRMRAVLTGVAVPRYTLEGMSVYTSWLGDQRLISPMVILPHAWKRYAERTGCGDLHGDALIRHYFTNNTSGADSHNQRVVGRSVRYNGEEHLSMCVNEGILLGQMEDGIFVVRTFITYDMCSGLQDEEFSGRRSEILTDRELHERAKRYYDGREFAPIYK